MRTGEPECRVAWRPSRWEFGGVLLLGACGAAGVLVSAVPGPWAGMLSGVACVLAFAQALRDRGRPVRRLVVADAATLDGERLTTCRVAWRGPLAFLQARDTAGRWHRLAWWPDTLSPQRRRALRLALDALTPR